MKTCCSLFACLQSFDEEKRTKEELLEQSIKEKEIDKIKSELEMSVAEKDKALDNLKTEYQLSAKEKHEINLQLQEALMERESLKADLERTRLEKIESDQLLQSSIQKDQVEQAVSEKDKLIEKLKKKLKEMRSEAKEMSGTLNTSKAHEKELESAKAQLETRLQENESKLEETIRSGQESMAALKNNFEKEINEKETLNENLAANLRDTHSKLQDMAAAKEQLHYQLIQAEKEHKNLQKEQEHIISGLRDDLDQARNEGSRELQATVNALLADKENLQKLLSDTENDLTLLKEECRHIEEKLKLDLEKVSFYVCDRFLLHFD